MWQKASDFSKLMVYLSAQPPPGTISGNRLSVQSGGARFLDRPFGGSTFRPTAAFNTMTFKYLAKWRPRNLELVRSILEDAPGALPVELETIQGAAFLSVNRRTEGRIETLSVPLRRDWLEEAAGVSQLTLAVRRFAECASGFEENPIVHAPQAASTV